MWVSSSTLTEWIKAKTNLDDGATCISPYVPLMNCEANSTDQTLPVDYINDVYNCDEAGVQYLTCRDYINALDDSKVTTHRRLIALILDNATRHT